MREKGGERGREGRREGRKKGGREGGSEWRRVDGREGREVPIRKKETHEHNIPGELLARDPNLCFSETVRQHPHQVVHERCTEACCRLVE